MHVFYLYIYIYICTRINYISIGIARNATIEHTTSAASAAYLGTQVFAGAAASGAGAASVSASAMDLEARILSASSVVVTCLTCAFKLSAAKVSYLPS